MDAEVLELAMGYVMALSSDQLRTVMTHCAALHAHSEGVETTVKALDNISRALRPGRRSPNEIIHDVARKHGMSFAELTGHSRRQKIVKARWEAMHLLRERTTLSLPQIARRLGLHDHSTVIHGLRRYRADGGFAAEA